MLKTGLRILDREAMVTPARMPRVLEGVIDRRHRHRRGASAHGRRGDGRGARFLE
jgi:hypothetical protein